MTQTHQIPQSNVPIIHILNDPKLSFKELKGIPISKEVAGKVMTTSRDSLST